jgi:hypothetical protein
METSENINELASALSKAQAAFKPITRDKTVTVRTKTGGSYSFSYAPLEAILRAVQPALAAHGLALTQSIEGEYLVTTLWLGAKCLHNAVKIIVGDGGPQAYGSALTYARRYGVTLLLCVCADDDDDGNAAEGNTATPAAKGTVNGLPRIDPMGENATKAPSTLAKLIASNFKAAWEMKSDEQIITTHATATQTHDDYQQGWKMLPAAVRAGIKDVLDKHGVTSGKSKETRAEQIAREERDAHKGVTQ